MFVANLANLKKAAKPSKTIYEERAPISRFAIVLAIVGLVALFLAAYFTLTLQNALIEQTALRLPASASTKGLTIPSAAGASAEAVFNIAIGAIVVAMVVFALSMLSFFNMRFAITSEEFIASMPPLRYRVQLKDIESVELLEQLPLFLGWGLRIWSLRRLAFVSRRVPALLIRKRSGWFREVVITPRDAKGFALKLKQVLQKASALKRFAA